MPNIQLFTVQAFQKVAYEVHTSESIYFKYAVNGWVDGVNSYRPAVNITNVHLLSDGFGSEPSRWNLTPGPIRKMPFCEPDIYIAGLPMPYSSTLIRMGTNVSRTGMGYIDNVRVY